MIVPLKSCSVDETALAAKRRPAADGAVVGLKEAGGYAVGRGRLRWSLPCFQWHWLLSKRLKLKENHLPQILITDQDLTPFEKVSILCELFDVE